MPVDTIRVAFIGCGVMAQRHAASYEKIGGAPIVGFCDVAEDRAQALAEKYAAQSFGDVGEMLDAVGPDGVYIVVPPFAHGEAEFACIERKIPFFVEKPINLDLSQAEDIAHKVQQADLLTAVGYHNRYRTGVNKARQILQDDPAVLALGGWIGESPLPNPEVPITVWWIDKSKSGGQFLEQATHTVDLVRFLIGEATEVAAVAAQGFNVGIPDYNIEDAWAVSIKFASGAVANLHACCASNAREGVTLDVYAKNCAFQFTGWDHHCKIFRTGREQSEEIIAESEEQIFYQEDAAFVDMLRTGDQSKVQSDYADALNTFAITVAADRSAATSEKIPL